MIAKTTLVIALLAGGNINLYADTRQPASATGDQMQLATQSWEDYLATSKKLQRADQDFLQAELTALGQKKPSLPEHTKEFGFEVKQPPEWFKSAEGKRVMDIILSFQTPSGGWSKRTDMSKAPRKPGQAFGVEKGYIPTFDNGATSTQLMLLAQAHQATGDQRYSAAFGRGLQLILTAQYPNGGWPQNFPLTGSYHDHITYNDGLMRNLMVVLHKTAQAKNEYAFATKEQQAAASASLTRALDCVLKSQVIVNGTRTLWGAQHDIKTLQPTKARAFEMVSLSTTESASMLSFLMDLKNPGSDIIQSVHAASAWYEQNKIVGKSWTRGDAALKDDKNASPLWARFYEIGTNKPVFGDRDDTVYYDLAKVSEERREGYAWYSTDPNKTLKKYVEWSKKHPK
ncbi:MAG TPA: pectate lyase [Cellvibrio sp.]|nr:pectate lyase [Cellvibrio sp.]